VLHAQNKRGLVAHNFAHVENDNGGFEADTKTGDQTTSDNDTETVTWTGDHLDDDTDDVDEAASNDSPLATDHVGQVTGNEGAKEGTAGQDGDDQGLLGRGQGSVAGAHDDVDELLEAIDTVDVPRVITEEDTAEGGEGTDEVGLPGDRRLDAVDVGSRREGTNFARHVGGGCRESGKRGRREVEERKKTGQALLVGGKQVL
jgi:hypothetical protein